MAHSKARDNKKRRRKRRLKNQWTQENKPPNWRRRLRKVGLDLDNIKSIVNDHLGQYRREYVTTQQLEGVPLEMRRASNAS